MASSRMQPSCMKAGASLDGRGPETKLPTVHRPPVGVGIDDGGHLRHGSQGRDAVGPWSNSRAQS